MHSRSPQVAVVARELALTFSEPCVMRQASGGETHARGRQHARRSSEPAISFSLVCIALWLRLGSHPTQNHGRCIAACDPLCKQGVRDLSRMPGVLGRFARGLSMMCFCHAAWQGLWSHWLCAFWADASWVKCYLVKCYSGHLSLRPLVTYCSAKKNRTISGGFLEVVSRFEFEFRRCEIF